jgi:peptide/nickel transport system substrate-binding protein
MTRASKRVGALVAVAAVAVGLAACSSSANSNAPKASTTTSSEKPVSGGTLNIVSTSGPSYMDPVPSYVTTNYMLERIYTRQLVSYQTVPYSSTSSAAWTTDVTPAADAATEVPTVANGGITDGGKVYTFHIKPGVDWDTSPARQVTSQDFLREFKAFFNPVAPVGNAAYYTSTIEGMQAYDNAETAYFAKIKSPTPAQIANFQNTHSIAGISTPNSSTISFTLTGAYSDFLYMLAMPFASARPVEYDSYLPGSLALDEHLISDGPYSIPAGGYVAGKSITFVQNPTWKQSTDDIRHQYVSKIVETINGSSAETQLSDVESGSMNLTDEGTPLNVSAIQGLIAKKVPWFEIWQQSNTWPYVVFNLQSPNSNKVAANLDFRIAVEYGTDKQAMVKAVGGPQIATVINGVIPPGNGGYVDYNLYPDNNGSGNVAECKSYLAKAGYAKGVTVNYMYQDDTSDSRLFQVMQASLAQCGITLKGQTEPTSSFFTDLSNAPSNKPGQWDLAQSNWFPDWFGNNGRTMIQALFQGPACYLNTVNYGCYDNATVNSDITKAETASSEAAAGAIWHSADEQIMKDAAIVPIMSENTAVAASSNVRGVLPNGRTYQTALFNPNIGDTDLANIYLTNG